MSRPARRLLAAIARAVALGVLGVGGVLALPGVALATVPDAPVAVSPEEGAFVESGTVVLEWTAVDAPGGYEVSWSSDAGEHLGTASTGETSVAIEIESGAFTWEVRALPDGVWSSPATFYADLQLPTLEQPASAPVSPAVTGRGGLEGIPGGVWILGALAFSAVFLAVVVVQSRLHREQDV